MTALLTFLNEWQCSKSTAVGCIKDLGKDLHAREMLSKANLDVIGNEKINKISCSPLIQALTITDLWATDLINVGYEDVTASADTLDPLSPCVGQDALVIYCTLSTSYFPTFS